MIDRWRDWYRARTVREQRMLLAMAAVAAAVFAWLLVVRPLSDGLATARQRHDEAVVALAEAKAQAQEIAVLEKRGGVGVAEPVQALVGNAATESGFQLNRMEPQGGYAVLAGIDAARPQAFFAWVDQLESARGLVVERLNATANADRTIAAQVTFRARGR